MCRGCGDVRSWGFSSANTGDIHRMQVYESYFYYRAIPLLAEEGNRAIKMRCREATFAAQTGWSVRLQTFFDCPKDKFDVVFNSFIFESLLIVLASIRAEMWRAIKLHN